MDEDLAALRALMLQDERELASLCAEVLTILTHGDGLVETLNFNVVDVTVDPNDAVTLCGVLSINDETVQFSVERFVELASRSAEPLSGESLAVWRERRQRRVWPMPPAPA